MENHIFGEPVPAVYYPVSSNRDDEVVVLTSEGDDDAEPSWTVDVIRKGSNVVVGTVVINNTKLPPRRNKNKKIVWKLPSANNTGTDEDIPRFGKQDYPRLWEIYKEEKKKRRSLNKTTVTNASSNNSVDDGDNSCNYNDGISNNARDNIDMDDVQDGDDGTNTTIHVTDTCLNKSHSAKIVYPIHETAAASATPNFCIIAPPPGFEASASTTATNNGRMCNNPLEMDISTATTTTNIPTIRPPPGFS